MIGACTHERCKNWSRCDDGTIENGTTFLLSPTVHTHTCTHIHVHVHSHIPESEIRNWKCKHKWPDIYPNILLLDWPLARIEWPCIFNCQNSFHNIRDDTRDCVRVEFCLPLSDRTVDDPSPQLQTATCSSILGAGKTTLHDSSLALASRAYWKHMAPSWQLY